MSSPSATRLSATSPRVQLIAAFIAVYIIWGSTYLTIGWAVQTVPPFLMAGSRFFLAGLILYIWARTQGADRPTAINWRASLIVGGLLLVTGNGLLSWAEKSVPSSLAALLISSVPLWMAVIEWARPSGSRPSLPVAAGIVLGFLGVALLFAPAVFSGGAAVSIAGTTVILFAAISWAAGSLYSRTAPVAASAPLSNGMEMIAGGVLLLVLGLVTGEAGQLHLDQISLRSGLSLLYLILFGSIVAFSAYIFMLKTAPVALVSTYAYVNPVVAVLLGVAFNGERLTPLTLAAAGVIIAAVVVITTFRTRGGMRLHRAPATEPQVEREPSSREPDIALSSR